MKDAVDLLNERIAVLEEALIPFTQPEFRKLYSGCGQGMDSVVYQRNSNKLKIGDFHRAYDAVYPDGEGER
jgi:hypothetical protein